jgi:hypothetical protein
MLTFGRLMIHDNSNYCNKCKAIHEFKDAEDLSTQVTALFDTTDAETKQLKQFQDSVIKLIKNHNSTT